MKNKNIEIVQKLIDSYPSNKSELVFNNNYELLVSVILSAQCTDKRVNLITKKLFAVCNSPSSLLALGEDKLKEIIKPCGFYNNKAKNIIKASLDIVERFNGEVPNNRSDLISLAGVGEKTASVVLGVAFNTPAIAVDTHVFRLSKRIGLCNEKTPTLTMYKLQQLLPENLWIDAHFALVLHGRYVCHARKPNCEECVIKNDCLYYNNKKE